MNKNWNKNNIFKDFFWSSSEGIQAFSCFEGPYYEPKEINTDHQLDCLTTTPKSFQSCPTLWPHRWQPTRPCRPWDSPGKNTGVGCYFLLQCIKVKSESEVAQSYLTLCDPMNCSLPGSSIHGIFQARVLMTQQSHCWAYTPRKPELKETRGPQCSL